MSREIKLPPLPDGMSFIEGEDGFGHPRRVEAFSEADMAIYARAAVELNLQHPTSAPDSEADLLRKYIRHVVHCEGIDFLSGAYARGFFTPAEMERLNALSAEAGEQEET